MPTRNLYVSERDAPLIEKLEAALKAQRRNVSDFFVESARAFMKTAEEGTDPLNERLMAIEKRVEALENLVVVANQ